MDTDGKIYTSETISDNPFPALPNASTVMDNNNAAGAGSNLPSGSSTINNQSFPVQVVAVDTIANTINTKTQKILQGFAFTPGGSIQIGTYEAGVSGDIKISPDGIVAQNKLGDTTIAVDGDTGDVVIAGEIRSGTTVTGDVEVLGGGHILMYDSNGIPNIFIGQQTS